MKHPQNFSSEKTVNIDSKSHFIYNIPVFLKIGFSVLFFERQFAGLAEGAVYGK
jgi:hypothetical protein